MNAKELVVWGMITLPVAHGSILAERREELELHTHVEMEIAPMVDLAASHASGSLSGISYIAPDANTPSQVQLNYGNFSSTL